MRRVKALFTWSRPTIKQQVQLEDDRIITLPVSDEKMFNIYKGLIYCWIESTAIIKDNYTFSFTLFIYHEGKTYQYPSDITASFSQIQQLLNSAQNHKEYFATKKFPLCMYNIFTEVIISNINTCVYINSS